MVQYSVIEIDPLGYGNKDATISLPKKLEKGELHEPAVEKGAEIILSGECMADLTDSDDGCIDGRQALYLLYPSNGIEGDFEEVDISNPFDHKRAKVSGGGYMTALVMKLALDPHITRINEDLEAVATHLTHLGVYCGAHTGSHGHDGSVDCGANDKFDAILHQLQQLAPQINETVRALWSLCDVDRQLTDGIIEASNHGVARTLSHEGYFDGSNGEARFEVIMNRIAKTQKMVGGDKPVAVSKHLDGDHNEAFIILNTVKDKTFSQAAFKQKLQESLPDIPEQQLPQAFVVDLPRIVELAKAMATGRPNEEEAFQIALHAGLGFQLATAATLTDGSLRNLIISQQASEAQAA